MSLHCCRWFVAVLVASTLVGRAVAQETPAADVEGAAAADEEKTYHDLRRSKDRATKSAADRYFYLVRAQEWTSLNGKSKITAKYVAHDADLKWVKLSAVKGSGANRVTREITVDVAKLNKSCQSRVKQIDTLQKKLDELKVKEEDETNEQSGAEGYGGYGAPMRDERGAQTEQPPLPDPTSSERGASERGANDSGYGGYDPTPSTPAPAAQTPPAESSDPDPLGFDDLKDEPPTTAAADPRTALGRPPAAAGDPRGIYGEPSTSTGEAGPAAPVDRSQWKTNYAAFIANFTATPAEQGEPTIDWGELGELRGMHDALVAGLERGQNNAYGQLTAEHARRLGEVRWSAAFVELNPTPLDTGEREVKFDLPPLPEPLKLRFLIDVTESPDKWSGLQKGQAVEFIGRFDVKKAQEIIVLVRLPQ